MLKRAREYGSDPLLSPEAFRKALRRHSSRAVTAQRLWEEERAAHGSHTTLSLASYTKAMRRAYLRKADTALAQETPSSAANANPRGTK
jgi:hypothetical protein